MSGQKILNGLHEAIESEQTAAIASLRAKLAEAKEALRPFAEVPAEDGDHLLLVTTVKRGPFHFHESDLRQARAVLAKLEKGTPND